ncbi:DUF1272 domain-containing protein [Caulobacter segnis]
MASARASGMTGLAYGMNRGSLSFQLNLPRATQPHAPSAPPQLRTVRRRPAAGCPWNVRICGYECTYCAGCAETVLHNVCPTCGGGLAARPDPAQASPTAASA